MLSRKIPFNFILLGVSASLPYFVTGAALTRWLRVEGIDLSDIGLLSLGGLIVAANFLWSPLINSLKIPFLGTYIGLRRSWLAASQITLAILFFSLSMISPSVSFVTLFIIVLLIFFVASVQDISLDAYRVEYDEFFATENLASSYVVGWRIGTYLFGSVIFSAESSLSWPFILKILSVVMLLMVIVTLGSKKVKEAQISKFGFNDFFPALKQFIQNKSFVVILLLIAFFRLSDTVLGYMAYPFYTDVGFTGNDLAVKNLYNFVATFVGAFSAAFFMQKTSLLRGLFVASLTILFTNLSFSYLALYPTLSNLIWINFIDTFAQAFATACFLAFLVSLINRKFTAIQHAVFTSLMLVPGYVMRGYSGFFVESLDYYNFFLLCGFFGLPSVLLTYYLLRSTVFSTENILKLLSILLIISILIVSMINFGNYSNQFNDNLIHFSMYFFLTLVVFAASKKTHYLVLLLLLIIMGISIEIAQYFTGLRYFEYMDIIANSVGVFGGYLIYKISRNYLKN